MMAAHMLEWNYGNIARDLSCKFLGIPRKPRAVTLPLELSALLLLVGSLA